MHTHTTQIALTSGNHSHLRRSLRVFIVKKMMGRQKGRLVFLKVVLQSSSSVNNSLKVAPRCLNQQSRLAEILHFDIYSQHDNEMDFIPSRVLRILFRLCNR